MLLHSFARLFSIPRAEGYVLPEAGASIGDCIFSDLIFALSLAVDLDTDDVEHIEQHVAESLKRPGQAIALQPLQLLLPPRLRLGLGFAVAVQSSLFAVGVAHLDLYLFFIVGLEAYHFQLNLHVLGFLLVEAAVRDDVNPGGENLPHLIAVVEQDAAIKHGLIVLDTEEGADIVFLEMAYHLAMYCPFFAPFRPH